MKHTSRPGAAAWHSAAAVAGAVLHAAAAARTAADWREPQPAEGRPQPPQALPQLAPA